MLYFCNFFFVGFWLEYIFSGIRSEIMNLDLFFTFHFEFFISVSLAADPLCYLVNFLKCEVPVCTL